MASTKQKDYWAILGLKKGATEKEIRSAYKRLAKKHHPDVNPGDKQAEERFKEISEAYEVLSDPAKRKQWERGEVDFDSFFRQRARTGGGEGDVFSFGFGSGVQEILNELFGGGAHAPGGRRGFGGADWVPTTQGSDLEFEASISFMEAAKGTVLEVPLARLAPCSDCKGTGQRAGRPCPRCAGSGRIRSNEMLKVRIPAGVRDGARVRAAGKGEAGSGGGESGDLYVRLRVREHPYFRREGNDILLDLPLTVSEASLGTRLEVPTMDGRVSLTIPAGSSSGRRLRLRGKGITTPRSEPGDQFVILQIVTPDSLDEKSRALLQEFDRLNPLDPRADLGW